MGDARSSTSRWIKIGVTAIAALTACESPEPSAPAMDAGAELRTAGGLGEAALFVGNFTPGGSTNGVLRYDGRGAFIDRMVSEGENGLTISCCLAFGPDENLYVGSPLTSSVLRYHGVTGEFIDAFIPSGSGGLVVPLIPVFRDGILYVGDLGTRQIRRFNAFTGAPIGDGSFIATAPQGSGPGDPQHFVFGPDGNVYVASEATGGVLRYNGQTGAFMDVVVPNDADGVPSPSGLAFGPDGYLYVSSDPGAEVRRYDVVRRRLVDVFVAPYSGGVEGPVGTIFGPDGNLYMAGFITGNVARFDGETGAFIDTFIPSGRGGISGPRMIAFKSTTIVCHRPPGNPGIAKTLTIGYLSAVGHVEHGDPLGACAG